MIDGISSIVDFFSNFFVKLLEFLRDVFIPSDNYWSNNFSKLKNSFFDKFSFVKQFDDFFNSFNATTLSEETYSITIPKFNVNIDFSWYEPYRVRFKNILTGAFTLMFVGALVKKNDPKINMGG